MTHLPAGVLGALKKVMSAKNWKDGKISMPLLRSERTRVGVYESLSAINDREL